MTQPELAELDLERRESIQDGGAPRPALDRQNSVQTCSICLEAPQYSVETNCGHLFCAQCMLTYRDHEFERHPVRLQFCHCPICRTEVTLLNPDENLTTQNSELYSQVAAYNQGMSHTSRWPQLLVLALVPVVHLLLISPVYIPGPEMVVKICILIKYAALVLFAVANLNRR